MAIANYKELLENKNLILYYMVLVSLVLFMKTFYPEKIEEFREQFKVDKNNLTFNEYNSKSKDTMIGMVFMAIFIILNVIPALIVATSCSSNILSKIIKIPFAILFSDIYLFFHIIKIYGFKHGMYGFCGNPSRGFKLD